MTIKLDRSRIEARQDCELLRYLSYHYRGKGIGPLEMPGPLLAGIVMHQCLDHLTTAARLSSLEEAWPHIEQCLAAYRTELQTYGYDDHYVQEQWWLLTCLVKGFAVVRLPNILREYHIISTEQEFVTELMPGLDVMLRLDAVARHKGTNQLAILDYKTLKTVSTDWMIHHERSIQTMMYTYLLEEFSGEYVMGIQYEGLCKGYSQLDTAKSSPYQGREIQFSPFCYCYVGSNGAISWDWKSGLCRRACWDVFSSPKDLLLAMGDKLEAQFPTIPPVKPVPEHWERFKHQVSRAEKAFLDRMEYLRPEHELEDAFLFFEQNLSRCNKYGLKSRCPFLGICHQCEDPDDPSVYTPRVPHHASELE